ncbi:hypothetical protein ACF3NT_11790 [Naumannella halotolerans]|uniref:hypothetical protein n=1 Tax=Naumannella halotolerans TaxID=993414 RepID=UPI001415070D|nr:hypothetical protein [Naumannella halotolerans]
MAHTESDQLPVGSDLTGRDDHDQVPASVADVVLTGTGGARPAQPSALDDH